MSDKLTAQLDIYSLIMAIWRRGKPDTLLHHSDQGVNNQRTVRAADGRQ